MKIFSNLRDKLRAAYADWRSTWVNRWRVRNWPERISMLVPILVGAFMVVLSAGVAIWIAMWFFFGPPSVNIAGVMVDLDRSASLAGIDKDKNGIRDDIDNYIKVLATKKAYNEPQVRALQQEARSMQGLVTVDVMDANAVARADDVSMNAVNCIFDKLGEEDAYAASKRIQSSTVNTKFRVFAYMKYNHTQDGTVTTLPQGDTCEK